MYGSNLWPEVFQFIANFAFGGVTSTDKNARVVVV